MRRKFAILFATALVSVSGATACSGLQEDLQKRAQEEVEKGRQQVKKEGAGGAEEGRKEGAREGTGGTAADRRGGEEGTAASEGEGTVTGLEHPLWLRRSLTTRRRSQAEANAHAKCPTRKDEQFSTRRLQDNDTDCKPEIPH